MPASTPTPFLPFLEPVETDVIAIAIFEPFDTTSGEHTPGNLYAAAEVPLGASLFRWDAVEGADSYVLLLQDVGDPAGAQAGESYAFTTYAQFIVTEPETIVALDLEPGGVQRTLVLQVFAYADRELVGQSEAWALTVLSIVD